MNRNDVIHITTDLDKLNVRCDEISSETPFDSVRHVVAEIKRALYDHPGCPGLAAPQIGSNLRLCVVRTAKSEDSRFKVFLNPLIVSKEGLHFSREASLSIPDSEFIIPRNDKIHVCYQAEDGRVESETYFGAYGEVLQQLIQQLDGITLLDYGFNLDDVGGPEAFDSAPKKQQTEVLALYIDNLKSAYSSISEEINNNEDLKNLNDTINFMTGMLKGDITPIKEEKKEDAV